MQEKSGDGKKKKKDKKKNTNKPAGIEFNYVFTTLSRVCPVHLRER